MRIFIVAAGAALLAPQAEAATTYQFTATVTTEYWNFQETTGQSLGLVRAGDKIVGRFEFGDGTALGRTLNVAIVNEPVTASTVSVFRGGNLVTTLLQRPAFFSNGSRIEESQLFARDGDPRGLRDVLSFGVGGTASPDASDPDLIVAPVVLTPVQPDIVMTGWSMGFREKCASGSIATGNCRSDSPAFDFYSGTEMRFELLKAFKNNDVAEVSLYFAYTGPVDPLVGGNVENVRANLNSLTAVPEPASWATMLCGFVLLGGAVRRRSFRKQARAAARA